MSFRPHWVNGWWLRRFTDPFVDVDGQVVRASWQGGVRLELLPGPHDLRTFVRYRHVFPGDGGVGSGRFTVDPGELLHVTAQGGPANQSPFTPSRSN